MNATLSVQDLWSQILALPAGDRRWLLDKLNVYEEQEEALTPYTMEELNARIEQTGKWNNSWLRYESKMDSLRAAEAERNSPLSRRNVWQESCDEFSPEHPGVGRTYHLLSPVSVLMSLCWSNVPKDSAALLCIGIASWYTM